jgi:hypothetical protein
VSALKSNKYRSKLELRFAEDLTKHGIKFDYETMTIPYLKEHTYTPDFILPNGVIIETKGFWRSADRTKHKLIREQHPTLDIRFVFQNAKNKLAKKSKTTYAEYCDRKGWLWAEGLLPLKWLK